MPPNRERWLLVHAAAEVCNQPSCRLQSSAAVVVAHLLGCCQMHCHSHLVAIT
jgi:hypothetical protein